jgi:hypothetical protein
MKKPIWSNKEAADIASGMGNIFLVLACLILLLYLVLPLFGGNFQPRALILYGSWIGMALIMKYGSRYIRAGIRMKQYKWYLISVLMILFTLIWSPNYFGLFMSTFVVIAMLTSYKTQGKRGWQEEQ